MADAIELWLGREDDAVLQGVTGSRGGASARALHFAGARRGDVHGGTGTRRVFTGARFRQYRGARFRAARVSHL